MGLAHSDEQVARQIINDPAFFGPTGKFDAPTFRSILRQNGLTEKLFVKDQREFHLRQQLMDSTVRQSLVPDALLSQMYNHVLEKRVARYLIISLDATDEVGDPTEEELENFFSETKLRFTEPERRNGSILLITPERFAETIKISDDEIRTEYDFRHIARFLRIQLPACVKAHPRPAVIGVNQPEKVDNNADQSRGPHHQQFRIATNNIRIGMMARVAPPPRIGVAHHHEA